jgi:hypothetical protein
MRPPRRLGLTEARRHRLDDVDGGGEIDEVTDGNEHGRHGGAESKSDADRLAAVEGRANAARLEEPLLRERTGPNCEAWYSPSAISRTLRVRRSGVRYQLSEIWMAALRPLS